MRSSSNKVNIQTPKYTTMYDAKQRKKHGSSSYICCLAPSANVEPFNIVYCVFTRLFHSFVAEIPKKPIHFHRHKKKTATNKQTAWIHFMGGPWLFAPPDAFASCWSVHCLAFNKGCLKSKRLIIFGCFSKAFISFISGRTCRKHNTVFFFSPTCTLPLNMPFFSAYILLGSWCCTEAMFVMLIHCVVWKPSTQNLKQCFCFFLLSLDIIS